MLTCGAASAQQQFNGTWKVEVIPQRGTCDRVIRFPVVIQNGQVRYGGAEGIGVAGAVSSRGVIRGSVGAGLVPARVAGPLVATGRLRHLGGLTCSGPWRAEKLA